MGDGFSRSLFSLLDNYIEQCTKNDEECFVNSYVKSFGLQYDAEQLNYLLRDFLTGGSETTMTTIRWALIYLANHPDWQKRLQSQVRQSMIVRNSKLSSNEMFDAY
jgi:cytochrome P450